MSRRARRAPRAGCSPPTASASRRRAARQAVDMSISRYRRRARRCGSPAASRLGNADQFDLRIVGQFALLGDRQRHNTPPAKAIRRRSTTACACSVSSSGRPCRAGRAAPRRSRPDRPGASLTRSPLRHIEHLRHAGRARQRGVLGQMQRLAMNRDQRSAAAPRDHVAQFVAARMARDVHEMRAIGDDLDALVDQAVDDARRPPSRCREWCATKRSPDRPC